MEITDSKELLGGGFLRFFWSFPSTNLNHTHITSLIHSQP
jgi:hypothetical protein